MNHRPVFQSLLMAVLAFTALASACSPAGPSANQQATVWALSTRIAQTGTAAVGGVPAAPIGAPGAANTPGSAPANTPQPTQGPAAQTATALAQSQMATQTAQAAVSSQVNQATQEAIRPIIAELPTYGVDPNKGSVAWIQGPLTLQAEGYNSFKADNKFPGTVVKDFVLSANITWNTRFGDSGCGFVIRTDGDQNKPSQYLIAMTRFANGQIGFAVISKGDIVNGADLYPKQEDNRFSIENDSTNQLTIVGRGTHFQIYTNRTLIGEVDPDKEPVMPNLPAAPQQPNNLLDPKIKATFDAATALHQQQVNDIQGQYNQRLKSYKTANKDFLQGFVSMVAVTQSGTVTCTYNNAWLWLIED